MSDYIKDPADVLDYAVTFTEWLANEGDTITSYTVTVTPAGLTKDSDTRSAGVVTIWLSGGQVDKTYLVTCEATTTAGRKKTKSFTVTVQNQ